MYKHNISIYSLLGYFFKENTIQTTFTKMLSSLGKTIEIKKREYIAEIVQKPANEN